MGAGCSSPLRRLGRKRGKSARRDSISVEGLEGNNQDQLTIAAKLQQHHGQLPKQPAEQKLLLENEVTIQSEFNEDHPSTASYYTDGRNQFEDAQKGSGGDEFKQAESKIVGASAAAAKMIGLSGTYIPNNRHLLVSPALSPAPSTCQSPAPTSPYAGCPVALDLRDAFNTLTFGSSDNQLKHGISRPEKTPQELHNYYTQQLLQNQVDLINYISVVFVAIDNSPASTDLENNQPAKIQGAGNASLIDTLANRVESNLRSLCDENSFNLRFLNLSHENLCKVFRVNNLQEVAMRIFEQEYHDNGQRLIVIILANGLGHSSSGNGSSDNNQNDNATQQSLDKRQLPVKIEAQSMNKLLSIDLNSRVKELLKQWYNQVGNTFYLNPIYKVYPKILSESKEDRDQAWTSWYDDSRTMIKAFKEAINSDQDMGSAIKLDSLAGFCLEFITRESNLQRRTLLIRNYNLSGGMSSNQHQQQQVSNTIPTRDANLSDIARLLSDPNKLSLKRIMSDQEIIKASNDWLQECFCKYLESFQESHIVNGKYVPSFIERNLFVELSRQRHNLEHYLENITQSFESKCHQFYTNQIQPILEPFSRVDNAELVSNLSVSKQSLASQPSMNHLILISGPRGCGKTTMFAQLVKHTVQDLLNKVQIIYRFCGLSQDSLSPNRLLRSICEQFCQTQGENITAAAHIYSARREIMNALNKIIQQQNSLILLDAVDTFESCAESCLDWLCDIEATSHIKIIIMLETDSELYKKMLGSYTDATYISLDNPSISEWAQMLTSTARTKRFNSASNLYDEIKNLSAAESRSASITYKDVSDTLHMCHIRRLNNEYLYPELTARMIQGNSIQSFKNVQQVILMHLHYLLPPYLLCSLFVALDSSRNGISEQDITNIINMISQQQQKNINTGQDEFPTSFFSYLKIQLKPWLRYIICDKTVKLTLQKDFLASAIEYYVPNIFPKIVGEVREALLEYYNRPFKQRQRSSKVNIAADGSPNELRELVSFSERLWLGTQVSELMHLQILTNPTKAKDYILNKQQFFSLFLHRSNPEEFIEDYDRLKAISSRKMSQNEELQYLVSYIRQSIFPLRYDGSQIYSQIYCRAHENLKSGKFSKSKKFNDILSVASCPPIRNLLPISDTSIESFTRTRIGQPPSSAAPSRSTSSNLSQSKQTPGYQPQQQQARQKIYTINDNHRHVIVIHPDKNCLLVWDIFEEKPVRTINNVDQPRDLRMIDQKRAVVLCNRELRVYDLDSGTLITKLKGVMNQKMPFFEVFGEDYVVALARNRMYVNMLNLNTGELETTFKVGEDRFLNSLLVSANGGICVCGDETQKPFPLLVWNLNERRLLYDLRLDRHEFITRMSAISDDGHFVVSVCKQLGDARESQAQSVPTVSDFTPATGNQSPKSSPNFIVIYDLSSGTLFKKWKPGLDTCGVAISLSPNKSGKVISTIVDSTILVWDLSTGSRRHTLVGHSAPVDVVRVQNDRLFSMDSTWRDQSLRIWDIDEGYCLAVFSPDAPVSCCQISTRGDALICGFIGDTRLSTLAICKHETVNDVVKRNKRRKSSKPLYIFDDPPSRKPSS